MGVQRLWTFIEKNKNELVEYVDLVEVARKSYPDGMKILVDFYSFEHFLKEKYWRSMTLITGNPNLVFDGGEYDAIDSFTKSFIASLRSVGIELVFYTDGAKGSSYQATQQKMKTWQERHKQDHKGLQTIMQYLHGQVNKLELLKLNFCENIMFLRLVNCCISSSVLEIHEVIL